MSNRNSKRNSIDEITEELRKLEIDYESKRARLIQRRNSLLIQKERSDKKQSNPFKIGQRVIICNNYSGDYGVNSKGVIGIVTRVTKVLVHLESETNGRGYSRSYKNLKLVE
jgi:hypothetical protein